MVSQGAPFLEGIDLVQQFQPPASFPAQSQTPSPQRAPPPAPRLDPAVDPYIFGVPPYDDSDVVLPPPLVLSGPRRQTAATNLSSDKMLGPLTGAAPPNVPLDHTLASGGIEDWWSGHSAVAARAVSLRIPPDSHVGKLLTSSLREVKAFLAAPGLSLAVNEKWLAVLQERFVEIML